MWVRSERREICENEDAFMRKKRDLCENEGEAKCWC